MQKFESNVQYIKYLVNKEVVKKFFEERLQTSLASYRDIAESIIPGPKAIFRCCIYKERNIIEDRVRLAMEPTRDNRVINVLDSACDECPIDRFVVTEACRGCMAHKCQEVCPRNAIDIVDHRAYINQNLCIECGRCKSVCPFNAISEVMRPCSRSCSAGAVRTSEDRKVVINHDKCVSCGSCVYQCPFGAIVDKSFVLEVLQVLKDSWNNTNYRVYAVVSPAIASQFPEISMGKVMTAIKNLGFYDVVEGALGADMVALEEAKEFAQTIEEQQWKASSSCPAFVNYIERNYPQLMSHVSTVVSPMIATARGIKSVAPKAKVVFIGPCTAQKVEIKEEELQDAVDIVITFEEMRSMFDAKGLDLENLEESPVGNASYYGCVSARTGGTIEGLKHALEVQDLQVELKPVVCNGLDECIKALRLAALGKLKGNYIEGMACKHGCTAGACSIDHDKQGIDLVNEYGKTATALNSLEAIAKYDLEKIELHRESK